MVNVICLKNQNLENSPQYIVIFHRRRDTTLTARSTYLPSSEDYQSGLAVVCFLFEPCGTDLRFQMRKYRFRRSVTSKARKCPSSSITRICDVGSQKSARRSSLLCVVSETRQVFTRSANRADLLNESKVPRLNTSVERCRPSMGSIIGFSACAAVGGAVQWRIEDFSLVLVRTSIRYGDVFIASSIYGFE